MNKKIYNAPEMEVVMVAPMQLIAESIPMNDEPAIDGMESKFIDNIVDDDEDMY